MTDATTEITNQTPTPTTHKILRGHVSEATALVQPDYPYSFTLRCERRVWIETGLKGPGKDQDRFVTQTRNPKTGRWNAPKCSTYSSALFLIESLAEPGHVSALHVSLYRVDEFLAVWGTSLTSAEHKRVSDIGRVASALNAAYSRAMAKTNPAP